MPAVAAILIGAFLFLPALTAFTLDQMTERQFAIDVVRRLRDAGFEALWAGGCVRDELLGLIPADYDVATNARPEAVEALFQHTLPVGKAFGVIQVRGPRRNPECPLEVEVATFRVDLDYGEDGRRPTGVIFSTAEEDAKRRDFTINGMFFDPLEERVIDYVGGRADLEAKILRAIGDPFERFGEDKLRMLRAARIATRFGLTIEPVTVNAIRSMAAEITVISAERIAEELRKLLIHSERARGLRLMDQLNLIEPILPELVEMKGLAQGLPAAPNGDLWDHVLKVMEVLKGPTWPSPQTVSFPLAFGTLLHDIGKRRTLGRTPEKFTFHSHEHVGKRMAGDICLRLKLSNDERTRIEWLVEKHQYLCDAPIMRASRLKPVLVHPGIGELLALHRADSLASGKPTTHVEFCENILRVTPREELDPPPLLTGYDLISVLGLTPGPLIKTLLDAVREAQLESTIRTKDEALEIARRLLKESSDGGAAPSDQ
jgi:poly(A) polymerase